MIVTERENLAKARPGQLIEQREEELARAGIYRLLALLLSQPPDKETLRILDSLGDGASPIDEALRKIADKAKKLDADSIMDEFHNLFIGLGEGELVPYGSYYLSGFLHEKPLARLRSDLHHLKIQQRHNVMEPEDSMSSLCEVMSLLVAGEINGSASLETQQSFFTKHLGSWGNEFFEDLKNAKSSRFYSAVGDLGIEFINVEKQAFELDH